ncbi:MAG: hypothetical protein UR78_C0015G0019 [Candidatus Moranbacteria bacterium GW2011_GWF2_35_39]|nr:MAG: hypothetical protein UR78_C0015G0019 [Candidatus Moranbacteria bacterium GW2011_GWF2_35_39]
MLKQVQHDSLFYLIILNLCFCHPEFTVPRRQAGFRISITIHMKKLTTFLKKFFLIDDTPHKVAAGAALGIFLGIIPGGILTAIVIAWIIRVNRLSAVAGVLATNFWTSILIMPFAAKLGCLIFGVNSEDLIKNFNQSYSADLKYFFSETIILKLLLPLSVGFIIIAGAIALAFYFLIYFLLKYKKVSFR